MPPPPAPPPTEPPPTEACQPGTCFTLNLLCGEHPDGCGGTLHCDEPGCDAGQVCGAVNTGQCGTCAVEEDLGSALPVHRSGDPKHYGMDTVLREYVLTTFTWTAPRRGPYVISNAGSGSKTWLRVRAGGCNGAEVPGPTKELPDRYFLEAGQTVHVSLFGDGYWRNAEHVFFQLHIAEWTPDGEQGRCGDRLDNDGDGAMDCQEAECASTPECRQGSACADVDLGAELPVTHGTDGFRRERGYDLFETACGPLQSDERVFRWTAPRAGAYVFQIPTSAGALSLWDGCGGQRLACDVKYRPDGPVSRMEPVLVRTMARGESVLIVVEGSRMGDEYPTRIWDGLRIFEQVPEDDAGLCEDGLDNDGDGFIDWSDRNCPNYREP